MPDRQREPTDPTGPAGHGHRKRFTRCRLLISGGAAAAAAAALAGLRGCLSSLPLDLVTAPDAILADALDRGRSRRSMGGPLRLVVARQFAYTSVKWVVRIEITAESVPG